MPQVVTSLIESVADTALIVRPVAVVGTHTITIGTFFKCNATSGAFAITLPSAGLNESRILIIKKSDVSANVVTVTRAGSDTIDGLTTFPLTQQFDSVTLINDEDGDIWNVIGVRTAVPQNVLRDRFGNSLTTRDGSALTTRF